MYTIYIHNIEIILIQRKNTQTHRKTRAQIASCTPFYIPIITILFFRMPSSQLNHSSLIQVCLHLSIQKAFSQKAGVAKLHGFTRNHQRHIVLMIFKSPIRRYFKNHHVCWRCLLVHFESTWATELQMIFVPMASWRGTPRRQRRRKRWTDEKRETSGCLKLLSEDGIWGVE